MKFTKGIHVTEAQNLVEFPTFSLTSNELHDIWTLAEIDFLGKPNSFKKSIKFKIIVGSLFINSTLLEPPEETLFVPSPANSPSPNINNLSLTIRFNTTLLV